MDEKNIDSNRENTKAILFITTVIFGILGATTCLPLLMSVMAFDAPGSENNILTWIIFLCLFSFAPICFLSIIFSWFIFYAQNYKIAKLVAFAPSANIIVLL